MFKVIKDIVILVDSYTESNPGTALTSNIFARVFKGELPFDYDP